MKFLPAVEQDFREQTIYRRNGKSVDKIIRYDLKTGKPVKITNYDYFNDKKIRSVDEFDNISGKKIRTINYVLYKSVDEFDIETGCKIRTINFNVKDSSKISSIQEYDKTGKIISISVFKRDGKTVSITKNIDPITQKVTNLHNLKFVDTAKYTRSYENVKFDRNKEDIGHLIDSLYRNNMKFENIK